MLIESLMAANAAFAVIKKTLANGKDIVDAGGALGDYFKAENDIAKEVATKGKGSALEAFQAQQQLRKQEEELKYMLNKQGLLGYHDFLEFKAQHSRDQKDAIKEQARLRHKRSKAIEENVTVGLKALGILSVIIAALFGVALHIKGLR